MSVSPWNTTKTVQAQQWWATYQREHDLVGRHGQTAGIDPVHGRVWFGDSAQDIIKQMEDEGRTIPLYFVRVSTDYYLRKGGRQ